MDNRTFHISQHTLSRMATRNISHSKLAEIIFCGRIYSSGKGNYRAKLYERAGKREICYEAVFSKSDRCIISVWSNIKPVLRDENEDTDKKYSKFRIYKQRKRALKEQEFDFWCREEYGNYNLLFSA